VMLLAMSAILLRRTSGRRPATRPCSPGLYCPQRQVMLAVMRSKAVLVLGCVLAALVMACGDKQPPTPTSMPRPATATAIPGHSQAKAAPTVKSTQQNAQDVPTPSATSSPLPSVTRIPTSASTPIAPETQSTGLPEPEILYEFSGSGTGETALFDAG
jgi:hypothetical protein